MHTLLGLLILSTSAIAAESGFDASVRRFAERSLAQTQESSLRAALGRYQEHVARRRTLAEIAKQQGLSKKQVQSIESTFGPSARAELIGDWVDGHVVFKDQGLEVEVLPSEFPYGKVRSGEREFLWDSRESLERNQQRFRSWLSKTPKTSEWFGIRDAFAEEWSPDTTFRMTISVFALNLSGKSGSLPGQLSTLNESAKSALSSCQSAGTEIFKNPFVDRMMDDALHVPRHQVAIRNCDDLKEFAKLELRPFVGQPIQVPLPPDLCSNLNALAACAYDRAGSDVPTHKPFFEDTWYDPGLHSPPQSSDSGN